MSLQQIKILLEQTIDENDPVEKDKSVQAAIEMVDRLIDEGNAGQELQLTWQEREFLKVFRNFKCVPGQVRDVNQIIFGLKGKVPHADQLDALNGLQSKRLVDFGDTGKTVWITEAGFNLISN